MTVREPTPGTGMSMEIGFESKRRHRIVRVVKAGARKGLSRRKLINLGTEVEANGHEQDQQNKQSESLNASKQNLHQAKNQVPKPTNPALVGGPHPNQKLETSGFPIFEDDTSGPPLKHPIRTPCYAEN